MKKSIRKIIKKTAVLVMMMLLFWGIGIAPNTTQCVQAKNKAASNGNKEKKKIDLNGTYHATLGLQTCDKLWITRMGYYSKDKNEMYGTKNAQNMFYKEMGSSKKVILPGDFKDVEIKGNGTYTVSVEHADFSTEKTISQLHVATDIPVCDDIKFTNFSAKINGREILNFEDPIMEDEEPYLTGGMVVLAINHWRAPLVKALADKGLMENAESGYSLLSDSGDETIELTFTVSGFDYDNPDAQVTNGEDPSDMNDASTSEVGEKQTKMSTGTREKGVVFGGILLVLVIVIAGVIVINRKKDRK